MRLHLLKDRELQDFLQENGVEFEGEVNALNEIFSEGDMTEDIFGAEFSAVRSVYNEIPQETYEEEALMPIEDLLRMEFDELELYFGSGHDDIMNLLVILAYLDRNLYEGALALHLLNDDYDVTNTVLIDVKGFYEIYVSVFLNKKNVISTLPEIIRKNIDLYLQKQ